MLPNDLYQMMFDNDEMWVIYNSGNAMLMLDLPLFDA